MLKLAKCLAPPLNDWASEITAALNIISSDDGRATLELILRNSEGMDINKEPSVGLFESIVSGLVVSCKSGPLPADSFTFVFPVYCFRAI